MSGKEIVNIPAVGFVTRLVGGVVLSQLQEHVERNWIYRNQIDDDKYGFAFLGSVMMEVGLSVFAVA